MSAVTAVPQMLRLILDSIRFEHTIFTLPFAYLGMVLAADGLCLQQPRHRQVLVKVLAVNPHAVPN